MIRRDIFLCGIKHSGKTTLGRVLALRLGCPHTDTDDLIERSLPPSMTVRSFYREAGPEAFRRREAETLARFLASSRRKGIISLGGGASDNDDVMRLARENGPLIYLRVDEEVLYRRIVIDGIPPFLEGPEPRKNFHALYERRDASYGRNCSLVVSLPDGLTVEETAEYLFRQAQGAFDGTQYLRS